MTDMTDKGEDTVSLLAHTVINGWIRAVLAMVSGWLIRKGVVDYATGQQLIAIVFPFLSGMIVLVGTGLWSTAEKRLVKLIPPQLPLPVGANPPAG